MYELVAPEYYDSKLHPTCANFRTGSLHLLGQWFEHLDVKEGSVCEVGAGKSGVLELLKEPYPGADVLVTDASPSMLQYSRELSSPSVKICIASAFDIPLPSCSASLLVSSLGDSYNTEEFWREATRVVNSGGWVIYTTPTYEWASSFRSKDKSASAEFMVGSQKHLSIPSWIYPKIEQIALIEAPGLQVVETRTFDLSQLDVRDVSPKLFRPDVNNYPIVCGYLATK